MTSSSSTATRRDGWWWATLVAGLLLVAYLVAILAVRMKGAWQPWAIDGDQGQAIGQYWRYHVDGALKPGHLQTDWAFAYFGPPVYSAMMATLCTFFEPLLSAKILQVLTFILLAAAAVLVVGRRTTWILGIAAGFLVLRSPDLASTMAGGIPRSFGPLLFLFFLAAFIARKHYLCLLMLVLQAATYPSVVVSCGITYGATCVIAGPTMKERLRRMAGMFVAGLLVIAAGKYQDLYAPKWWGPIVTYEEAATMRAWQKGGRFPDYPHHEPITHITQNALRGYKELGHTLAPDAAKIFVARHQNEVLTVLPMGIALVAVAVDRVRRRRRGLPPPDEDMRIPWQLLAIFAGSCAGYFLARVVAFKLFLPSRQLGHTIQYIVMMSVPIVAWCGARAIVGQRKALALVLAVCFSVVPVFAFRGDGLAQDYYHYNDYSREAPVFMKLRQLPLDAMIACDGYWCEGMAVFAYHRGYGMRNLTHPLRKGYYEEAERRLLEEHKALYCNSLDELLAFADKEHIDYFIYNTERVEKPQEGIYEPAKTLIHQMWREAKKKGDFALLKPPKEIVIYQRRTTYLIEIAKLRAYLAKRKAEGDAPPQPLGPELPSSSSSSSGAPSEEAPEPVEQETPPEP